MRRLVLLLGCATIAGALAPAVAAQPAPRDYSLGIYVTSVHHIDVPRRTADVDMWLWSVAPDERRPLQTIELLNADSYNRTLASTQSRPQGAWSQVKVAGTFRQLWSLNNFPFDRQAIEVVIEEGVLDSSSFVYRVDRGHSGYDQAIEVPGWQITGFDAEQHTQPYRTTFGDPLLAEGGESSYARVVATLYLKRTDAAMTFFTLTIAMYAAILLALATFFLHPDTMSDLGARLGLLAAALFAAVLNMIQASSQLGQPEGLSLLVKLHVVAFALIVVATAIGISSRRRIERGVEDARVRRFDQFSFAVCAVLVLAANIGLVAAVA